MIYTAVEELNIPELEIYADRKEVRLRRYFEPAPGLFIAETDKVILRALDAGFEPISFLVEAGRAESFSETIFSRSGLPEDLPVYVAEASVLERITGYTLTRGILCAMRRKADTDWRSVLRGRRRIVVFEDVMNPTNVGALFRSAAALGMDGVLLTAGCADPLYRRAIRVAMGTVFQIPWSYLPAELSENGAYVRAIREEGFATVAMALREDSYSIRDRMLHEQEQLAVLMGTEGEGLRQETIDACDYTVMIPMYHEVDSLNVAAAGAVAFWELGKR